MLHPGNGICHLRLCQADTVAARTISRGRKTRAFTAVDSSGKSGSWQVCFCSLRPESNIYVRVFFMKFSHLTHDFMVRVVARMNNNSHPPDGASDKRSGNQKQGRGNRLPLSCPGTARIIYRQENFDHSGRALSRREKEVRF